MIAKRMQAVKPSPTLSLTQKATELKKAGHDIIGLSAGEPDFPTPAWICDAATAAMTRGETRYTAVGGTPELKAAIAAKMLRDQKLTYLPAEIIASTGGKQVIFNALMATVNPGDEVLIPAPYWVSYADIVLIAEGSPVVIACGPEHNFKLTPDLLKNALTPQSKWLFLNSPSNPTGMVYEPQELVALADVLRQYPQAWILSDDIYEHILYKGVFTTLAQIAPDLKDRILIVNGLSKSYNMTGWRLGYGVGPKHLIEVMTNLQSQSTSNPCSITQAAGVAALNGPQDFIATQTKIFAQRRDLALGILAGSPYLQTLSPQGAFYLYPNCDKALGCRTPNGDLLQSDTDVAAFLLTACGVAVVPGSAFGLSPYLRLSYALETTQLEDACHRIVKILNTLNK